MTTGFESYEVVLMKSPIGDGPEERTAKGSMCNDQFSQPLRIRIPGLQVLTGRVCWHKGKVVGCEFATPLHEAVFTHICTAAGA